MATSSRDAKLTLSIESLGQENITKLEKELRRLADTGDASAAEFGQLADEISRLGDQNAALQGVKTLADQTAALQARQEGAGQTAQELAQRLEALRAATDQARAAQDTARQGLLEGEKTYTEAGNALRALKAEYDNAGKQTAEYRSRLQALVAAQNQANLALVTLRDENRRASEAVTQAAADQRKAEGAYKAAERQVSATAAAVEKQSAALREAGAAADALGVDVSDLAGAEAALQSTFTRATKAAKDRKAAIDDMAEADRLAAIEAKGLADLYARGEAALQAEVAAQREAAKAARDYASAARAAANADNLAADASARATQSQAQKQRTLRDGLTDLHTQFQRIQQIATIAIGGGFLGSLAKDVATTADEFKNLEARIKITTGEGPLFEKSFGGVQRAALATNSSLEETGNLFARLTKASQEGGMAAAAAQERALRLTTTINQATQLSGGAAESARAALTQLIQGLQSGVLRGEEFNSVMEQAPRLAEALSKGLNVTTAELREMAGQGALTAETVMKALEGQADVVAREYGKLPPTVGRALQNLSTQWTLYVGAADKGLISSANAAKVIDALAGNLDILVNTLTAAGKVWGAMQIAKIAEWFAGWATKTLAATQAVEANSVATTANTAAHRANAIAVNASAAAQAANATASVASTAAQAANAKSWAGFGDALKGVSVSQGELQRQTARSTAALTTATAAKGALGAAATAATGKVGLLGRGIGAVTGFLGGPVGLAVSVVAFLPELKKLGTWMGETAAKVMGHSDALKENEAQTRLAEEAARQHADALRRQAVALEEVRNRSFDLNKESTGLIGQFDKLRKEGDTAAEAIAKIGKDFDLGSAPGIRNASAVLDKLVADGKISASEFQGAWAKALDGQDLMKFEILARQAFATAGSEAKKLGKQIEEAIKSGASEEVVDGLRQRLQGALAAATREGERVAEMMDNVLRAAVQRTGLEFTALEGRIGAASRSALNDLDVVIGGLGRLKQQGIDVGRVLEASLVKAINTADSQKAIDEVRVRVEELRKTLGDRVADGLLDQAKTKALELSDTLDKAKPGINSLREAMKALGVTSDEALKQVATSSRSAFDFIASSGKASARELSEGFKKAAEDAIAANKGIAPEWVKSAASVRGFKIEVDDAGRATLKSVADIGRSAKGAGDQFKDLGRTAADVLRSMGIEADKVSDKVQQLVKQGQMLSAAFQQRQDNRNREIDQSKFMNRGAMASQDLVPTFNSRAEAEAWRQKWEEQYARDNPFSTKSTGALGNFMFDLTMAEYQGELDALAIREAMEEAKKKAEAGSGTGGGKGSGTGGGTGDGEGGSGGGRVDRIVNVYIGNSKAYPVPTTATGQQSIEAIAREFVRDLENARGTAL